MLRNLSELYAFSVATSGGSFGEVRNCYLDEQGWKIRFIVVETGPWLGGRKVLPNRQQEDDPFGHYGRLGHEYLAANAPPA